MVGHGNGWITLDCHIVIQRISIGDNYIMVLMMSCRIYKGVNRNRILGIKLVKLYIISKLYITYLKYCFLHSTHYDFVNLSSCVLVFVDNKLQSIQLWLWLKIAPKVQQQLWHHDLSLDFVLLKVLHQPDLIIFDHLHNPHLELFQVKKELFILYTF